MGLMGRVRGVLSQVNFAARSTVNEIFMSHVGHLTRPLLWVPTPLLNYPAIVELIYECVALGNAHLLRMALEDRLPALHQG